MVNKVEYITCGSLHEVDTLIAINEVNQRRARLITEWPTVNKRANNHSAWPSIHE